jgi:hypothetical protein
MPLARPQALQSNHQRRSRKAKKKKKTTTTTRVAVAAVVLVVAGLVAEEGLVVRVSLLATESPLLNIS